MKITLKLTATLLFGLSLAFLPTSVLAIDKDKELHFGFSAFFGAVADGILYAGMEKAGPAERMAWATAAGTVPGLIKEVADSSDPNNTFDNEDLAYDVAGAFVGALASELFWGNVAVSKSGRQISLTYHTRW